MTIAPLSSPQSRSASSQDEHISLRPLYGRSASFDEDGFELESEMYLYSQRLAGENVNRGRNCLDLETFAIRGRQTSGAVVSKVCRAEYICCAILGVIALGALAVVGIAIKDSFKSEIPTPDATNTTLHALSEASRLSATVTASVGNYLR